MTRKVGTPPDIPLGVSFEPFEKNACDFVLRIDAPVGCNGFRKRPLISRRVRVKALHIQNILIGVKIGPAPPVSAKRLKS
jgi:hypothetical protein